MAKMIKRILLAIALCFIATNAQADCVLGGVVAAGTDNSTLVRAGTGSISMIYACNSSAALKYVKFYDKATAPTCGTDIPKIRIMVPASTCAPMLTFGGTNNQGQFVLGLGYCMVTGAADNSTTAVTAADILLTYCYR